MLEVALGCCMNGKFVTIAKHFLTSWVSSSVPSPAGSSTVPSGTSGNAVVVVVDCPGLRIFTRAPGRGGLGPPPGSRGRGADFGVVDIASWDTSTSAESWVSSLVAGAAVVGLLRRRPILILLKDGREAAGDDAPGADGEVGGTAVVEIGVLDPVPRYLLRPFAGFSALTPLASSFWTSSS